MAASNDSSKSPQGSDNRPSSSGPGSQVAHTLTACCRCRQRKTRCDAGLPRCGPCERNNAYCEYFDAAKARNMPRSYVIQLQNRVRELEKELATFSTIADDEIDQETMIRGAGLVRIQDNDEPSFLGPSSGINMTRLVLELAKGIRKIKKIKDLVPEEQARRIRQRFDAESQKPSSKDYPEISSVAAPNLPSIELTDMLVENFFKKGQSLYPVLHEPSFRQTVQNVYNKSLEFYENFTVRMVIALGMQKLSSQWTGLADSYYLAALPYLEGTIRARNLGTIQSFMLIAQYSMVTPTRTASNWIVGLAVKICQELGLTQESTIGVDTAGQPLDPLEVDLRRRCFWVCASMEFGLAHSMGRPNAFGIPHTWVDVGWFEQVDDDFITRQGILPAIPSPTKRLAKHFISMRMLQLEIRRTLYLKRRDGPLSDADPWFLEMEQKLVDWLAESPEDSAGTPYTREWFAARHNTIVVFLCRPSPQIPEPSSRAASKCFDASRDNIVTQRKQIEAKVVDLTWIFAQSLFMAINTVLWAVSYADIRRAHPREEVEALLNKALETAYYCSLKWPGVEGATELYGTIQHTCLKAYDGDHDKSYSVASPINRPSPANTASPELIPSPLSADCNQQHRSTTTAPTSPATRSVNSAKSALAGPALAQQHLHDGLAPVGGMTSIAGRLHDPPAFDHQLVSFDTPLPPAISPGFGSLAPDNYYSPLFQPYQAMMEPSQDYSGTPSWPPHEATLALNLQQQAELMDQLEVGRMGGILG